MIGKAAVEGCARVDIADIGNAQSAVRCSGPSKPRVVLRMLLVGSLIWPALSGAQASEDADRHHGTFGVAPMPEFENRPRSDFESSLMRELACTCGSCNLEPISTCRCDFAAKMRGDLQARLDGLDLSTETARRTAAEAVRASFVSRYGSKVLERTNRLDPNGRVAAFVVTAIALALLVVLVGGIRSIRRRARHPPAAGGTII